MQKTIYQILILAALLFLAAFSAVWFDEGEGDEEMTWATKTAGGASVFLDALVRLSSPSSNSFSTGVRLEAEDAAGRLEDIALTVEEETTSALESGSLSAEVGQSSLGEGMTDFVKDVLSGAPSRYLDIRLYNRGLKDFFSFYWLGLTEAQESSLSY